MSYILLNFIALNKHDIHLVFVPYSALYMYFLDNSYMSLRVYIYIYILYIFFIIFFLINNLKLSIVSEIHLNVVFEIILAN